MYILIVDDDAQIVHALQRMLVANGHTTCHAYTGEGALELVRTEVDIGVILLDIDLGKGMDGLEVARRLPRGIPLIIMSGLGPDLLRDRAHSSVYALESALILLGKPIDMPELFKVLTTLQKALDDA